LRATPNRRIGSLLEELKRKDSELDRYKNAVPIADAASELSELLASDLNYPKSGPYGEIKAQELDTVKFTSSDIVGLIQE
jgi:hypothetical protein